MSYKKAKIYGKILESQGEKKVNSIMDKWDFSKNRYNPNYTKNGISLAQSGINNIKNGLGGSFNSIKNIGNPTNQRYQSKPKIKNYDSDII